LPSGGGRVRAHQQPPPITEATAARGDLAACAHPLFEVVPGAIEPWEKPKDF